MVLQNAANLRHKARAQGRGLRTALTKRCEDRVSLHAKMGYYSVDTSVQPDAVFGDFCAMGRYPLKRRLHGRVYLAFGRLIRTGRVACNLRCIRVCYLALLYLLTVVPLAQSQEGTTSRIEPVPLLGHTGEITSVEFSPDGQQVLTGSSDQSVTLWDTKSGRLIRTFRGGSGGIRSAGFSPDGSQIIAGGATANVIVWEMRSGKELRAFGKYDFTAEIDAVALLPDGRALVGSTDGALKLWDVERGRVIRSFEGSETDVFGGFDISSDHKTVTWSGTALHVSDIKTGKSRHLLTPPIGELNSFTSLRFIREDRALVSVTERGIMTLWDLDTKEVVWEQDAGVGPIAVSPDGSTIASIGSDGMQLWNTETGDNLITLEEVSGPLAFSPDGRYIITCESNSYELTAAANLWDLSSLALERQFKGNIAYAQSLAVSAKNILATGDNFGITKLWSLQTGELIAASSERSRSVGSMAFSPDGSQLASQASRGELSLLDPTTATEVIKVATDADGPVAFSPDGLSLAGTNKDGIITLWDAQTGSLLRSFDNSYGEQHSIVFSPDGSQIVSANTWDRKIALWDVATGNHIRQFGSHDGQPLTVIKFTPNGKFIVSGARYTGVLKIWNTAGKLVRSINTGHEDIVDIVVTPDGNRIITAGSNLVKIWDAKNGDKIRTFLDHEQDIVALAISADGQFTVSSSYDGKNIVWKTETGEIIVTLLTTRDSEWLTISPSGYFAASTSGSEMLSIRRDLEVYPISRFYEHLARQDLIAERLKGDPEGRYANAVSERDLHTILDSGPVPQVTFITDRMEKAGDTARVSVRIVDAGGGIGPKVIWRVNGQTQGSNVTPTKSPEGFVVMTNVLRMDPGKSNVVEVIAYNGSGLLTSDTMRLTIDAFGASASGGPRLFVLAIGVGSYAMPHYKLDFPEVDADAIAKSLAVAGKSLFVDVVQVLVTGKEVTEPGIAAAFERLKGAVRPGDVFVLFLSGHGETRLGRYYYVPQDFDARLGDTWDKKWIGQEKWELWLSGIVAEKQVLILDTCEGGSALGLVRGRPERETAMDQLQHATGRSIIAAAAADARESTQLGHGVLTYTILSALQAQADPSDDDGKPVTVFELAKYAQTEVMKIRQRIWGEPVGTINKLTENDFPLGFRASLGLQLESLLAPVSTTRYVLLRDEQVRQVPTSDGEVNRSAVQGTEVSVLEFAGEWALIAKDGAKWGYVPIDVMVELK